MSRLVAVCAACLGLGALLIAAPQAGAVERVGDGDFESTVCDLSTCISPDWTVAIDGEPPGPPESVGPLCGDPVLASGPAECFAGGGLSGYNSPYHWARLGSGTGYTGGEDRPPPLTTTITQEVLIPASPATLSFRVHIVPRDYATGTLTVRVGGEEVFDTVDNATGYGSYPLITVPVPVAGPDPVELRFDGTAEVDTGAAPDGTLIESDTFDVDDVSLDAPDAPAAPGAVPPPGTTTPAPAPSARKKCKRKKHARSAGKKKCHRKRKRAS